jgi:hypothetical protein
LLPFVEVPPLPDASPRPIRIALCVDPSAGFKLCSFMLFDFELTGYHPSQLLNNKNMSIKLNKNESIEKLTHFYNNVYML